MEPLAQALKELQADDWATRVRAVERLALIDDERAHQALIEAIYDPHDSAVTEAAVLAMLASGNPQYVDPLLDAINGTRPDLTDDEASDIAGAVARVLELAHDSDLVREVLRREAATE